MVFLTFFSNIWFSNIIMSFLVFYLLVAIFFAAHFSCCDIFGKPILIKSFNLFSSFVIILLFWLFCFDFCSSDKLFFFAQNFQMLLFFFVFFVLCCSYDFIVAKKIIKYEYDLLFIFVIFSGTCLIFCDEFLLVYLAIELLSLSLYTFATFNRNSEFSSEAGLKYFVFGGLMSCFLLFGFCLIYLHFGSISFELLFSVTNFGYNYLVFCGFFFLFCVLMFKIGAAPFHFWLCDVYEGAILSVTMLFASAPKIVLFGLLLKLCFFVMVGYSNIWSSFLGISAMFSIIVGSISAIYQKRLKRLFAYSTIAHTGFILLAFLCNSLDGSKSLIFYILIYSCLTIITFSVLINIAIKTPIQPKYLINLATVGSKNYIFASTFALIILSIAGIPPLAGFFSKFFILFSVISSEYYFIAMTIVIFSSIACFYYIRLVKILFFVKNSKNSLWFTNKSQQNNEIIIGSFLFFIIFYYFFPNFVIDFSVVVSLLMF